jgi:hypothetical protein
MQVGSHDAFRTELANEVARDECAAGAEPRVAEREQKIRIRHVVLSWDKGSVSIDCPTIEPDPRGLAQKRLLCQRTTTTDVTSRNEPSFAPFA